MATINGTSGNDRLTGTSGDDTLNGLDGFDTLVGGGGNDRLAGGSGWDTLTGGAGQDTFAFTEYGHGMNDHITDFTSGTDVIELDPAVFTAIGASGAFAPGDPRFYVAAGASGGHDPDDRIIYDPSRGIIYYDPDGSGPASTANLAVLPAGTTVAATDFFVKAGGTSPGTINGTSGDDTLVGTSGADTINGFGGNDSISGLAGNDSLSGGDGNDTLDGGPGTDTLNGGLGNDVYFNPSDSHFDPAGDVIIDAGGTDTVISFQTSFILPSGIENLILRGGPFPIGNEDFASSGEGNELDNVVRNERSDPTGLSGGGGNDTLIGSAGSDFFEYRGSIDSGHDSVDGGGGFNSLLFEGRSAVTVDFRNGTATDGFADVSFQNIQQAIAGAGNDLLIGGDAAVRLWGSEGNDTLAGGAGNDFVDGDDFKSGTGSAIGNDSLTGGGGNDTLVGGAGTDFMDGGSGNDLLAAEGFAAFAEPDAGNDTVNGGAGNDTVSGGGGADSFVFDQAPGAANADHVTDFASAVDKIHLDAAVMSALGASGNFSAGDARFYEAAGASAGHDADDRVVYDTSSGDLWYDADGSGAQAAQLIAILDGPASLAATDMVVENGAVPGGQHLVGSSGNDSIVGGPGNDTLEGLDGMDTLVGAGGNDSLAGGSGWDTLTGGAGQDSFAFTYYGKGMNDHITDFASGSDVIELDPAVFAALGGAGRFAAGDARFYAAPGASGGHDADDRVIYDTSSGILYYDPDGNGRAAPANIAVLSGAPALVATDIAVQSTGMGAGGAHLLGGSGNDSFLGSGGNDLIEGAGGNDSLDAGEGADTLVGGTGNDSLWGRSGADTFVFREAGSANADNIADFASGQDTIALDNATLTALGAEGRFAIGDARFYAAAGATGGHDASDRIVYNTSTGQLYYDDDGSGAHAAQLLATHVAATLAATDITVI